MVALIVHRCGKHAIRERSIKQAKEIGVLFGITPSARGKMSLTAAPQESKLSKFKKSKVI